MFKNSIKLGNLKTPIGVVLALSIFTYNPIATFLALLFVPFAAKLLWRTDEPPILFFAMMMQWLQVCIKIFYADALAKNFVDVFDNYKNINQAYYYSILALYAVTLGIFIIIKNLPKADLAHFKNKLSGYNQKKIVTLYIFTIFLIPILFGFNRFLPGFQQVFVKLQDLKWAIFLIFFTYYFLFDKNKNLFYLILIGEIIASLTGYFSSFKEFFIVGIILYIFVKKSYSLLNYTFFAIIIVLLFNLMIVWQYIKPQYRAYLSGGEQTQTVTVTKSDALSKLYDLSKQSSKIEYGDGIKNLFDRLAYIDIFSATIDYVPLNRPHEHGRLWVDAIKRVFMPRFLFPNKTAINDSDKTNTYSGLVFAGADSGTSVSLGYVTESYIDFGFPGMLVPLCFWGLLIGLVYKHILTKSYNIIWGYAFLVPLLFQINSFETALDKLIGSFIAFFLIYFLLNKFYIERLDNYIKN